MNRIEDSLQALQRDGQIVARVYETGVGRYWRACNGSGPYHVNEARIGRLDVLQHDGVAFVDDLTVQPAFRGQGIATALWEAAGRPAFVLYPARAADDRFTPQPGEFVRYQDGTTERITRVEDGRICSRPNGVWILMSDGQLKYKGWASFDVPATELTATDEWTLAPVWKGVPRNWRTTGQGPDAGDMKYFVRTWVSSTMAPAQIL
ncbi:Uncharacterised protein [Mycobacteroides abscessus subsp. abscessus]|uniref:GNAT family N-acetyltransferase n=1 Tax=Mycobacteroides abscessus TaxID=36809 RepID=UPI00092961EA|nr:GNAT family N-acetyltransferase [Mycobacteroides abscessus]SIC63737.1 Uncharacterised protein [Mycobacteroides abscessus subsp. abscessus]SIC95720.1 Uncharacterised protein [Mycobacteroides abscessus subsp. abscessus]SID20529.1 Uncharacterised protein [Mycobacteroides abscessus subsp. abscessus]SID50119.1 Uncharacterised protein [Mycobacteroides abscessus subsp. abscessus]SKV98006.1 Uncharacterised protein [Mycobacteroides abscessus subsp. abscessus]